MNIIPKNCKYLVGCLLLVSINKTKYICMELFHKHFVLVPLNIEDKDIEIDQLFLSFSFIKVNKYLTITFPATSLFRFIYLNQNTLTTFPMDWTSNEKGKLKI